MEKLLKILLSMMLFPISVPKIWAQTTPSPKTSSKIPVRVTNVISRNGNNWMLAMKDSKIANSWALKVEQDISKDETIHDIYARFSIKRSPNSFQEDIFQSNLCNLLTGHVYSQSFFKDIVNMILPDEGSCEIKKNIHSIKSTGYASNDIQQNLGINFALSKPYELKVDFLSRKLREHQVFLRVDFTVNNGTGPTHEQSNNNNQEGNGQSENKCVSVSWIAKPLCTAYETVASGVSRIVQPVRTAYKKVVSGISRFL